MVPVSSRATEGPACNRPIPDPLFRRVDPEMGHRGILTDHAKQISSHSEILKSMHAEYWILNVLVHILASFPGCTPLCASGQGDAAGCSKEVKVSVECVW